MKINNRAILTPEEVKKIRKLKMGGKTTKEIHSIFPQVTIWAIYKVLNYESWQLVT